MIIKNYNELKSENREAVLKIIEEGLSKLQPENFIKNVYEILDKEIKKYEKIFLIGFGKGSAKTSKLIEERFFDYLNKGWVIDVNEENFRKIKFTKGTHPLPSKVNFEFTKEVISNLQNLTSKDLVIVVIFGGGSAMFVYPAKINLETKIKINQELLKRNASIQEMNIVRKHLSLVKGGGLAKILYPAKVIGLIASDVPGDDVSIIASGPIVKDNSTIDSAWEILERLKISEELNLSKDDLIETPKEDKYFDNVSINIILSNLTALEAMMKMGEVMNFNVSIFSRKIEGNVKDVAQKFLKIAKNLKKKEIVLAGGETTVDVRGGGEGGRNQELCLWFLKFMIEENIKNVVFSSINSDGWDNTPFAGAIVDELTIEKVRKKNLNIDEFLENNNSYNFFKIINDGIETGRLNSNVSDLFIIARVD